jgi:hypothetical protein
MPYFALYGRLFYVANNSNKSAERLLIVTHSRSIRYSLLQGSRGLVADNSAMFYFL